MKRIVDWTIANIRRLVIGVVGGTVLLIGIIMIVTPGPAVVVIPMGLAILATEFIWARTLLVKVKEKIQRATERKSALKKNPLDNRRDD
jgi:uncharacterized protein (TIGR02611 family)